MAQAIRSLDVRGSLPEVVDQSAARREVRESAPPRTVQRETARVDPIRKGVPVDPEGPSKIASVVTVLTVAIGLATVFVSPVAAIAVAVLGFGVSVSCMWTSHSRHRKARLAHLERSHSAAHQGVDR